MLARYFDSSPRFIGTDYHSGYGVEEPRGSLYGDRKSLDPYLRIPLSRYGEVLVTLRKCELACKSASICGPLLHGALPRKTKTQSFKKTCAQDTPLGRRYPRRPALPRRTLRGG
jgi:hypothetical protein